MSNFKLTSKVDINYLLLLQCIDIARVLNYILDIGGRCMTTNLNIRTDKNIKDQAEKIFNQLGLNMTTAINMFLRTAVRENGIPFELKLDTPNKDTRAAIEEGRKLFTDDSVKRYNSIKELKDALDV